MAIKEFVKTLPLALGLLASPLWAAVSPEQASALGDSLTPMGAERAGNATGVTLTTGGNGLENYHMGVPFPLPQSGSGTT